MFFLKKEEEDDETEAKMGCMDKKKLACRNN